MAPTTGRRACKLNLLFWTEVEDSSLVELLDFAIVFHLLDVVGPGVPVVVVNVVQV